MRAEPADSMQIVGRDAMPYEMWWTSIWNTIHQHGLRLTATEIHHTQIMLEPKSAYPMTTIARDVVAYEMRWASGWNTTNHYGPQCIAMNHYEQQCIAND